jgi:hypothetical protein
MAFALPIESPLLTSKLLNQDAATRSIKMQYETKVLFYDNEKKMQKGIAKMQKKGWEVVETEVVERGYGCLKTGCFALIFLPLALLGKKPNRFKVTYRRSIVKK